MLRYLWGDIIVNNVSKSRHLSLFLFLSLVFSFGSTKPIFGFGSISTNLHDFYKRHSVVSRVIIGSFGLIAGTGLVCMLKKCFGKQDKNGASSKAKVKLPIVGGKQYDIGLWGIEKWHTFDSKKYGKVQKYLQDNFEIDEGMLVKAKVVTDEELLSVHTKKYLDSLNSSRNVAEILELGYLRFVPNFLLRWYLLNPMKLATGGTIQAAKLALKHGWAINLGGGYHHAKSDQGGGNCCYADIPIAVYKLWETNPNLRVMVVDLDAHQGNGHEAVFKNDSRVSIFDMYLQYGYPCDIEARQYIDFDVPISSRIKGEEYNVKLKTELKNALDKLQDSGKEPDLIIFNAGTDPLNEDPIGGMRLSEKSIIERDDIVFEQAKNRKIPIVYLFSGGYTKKSANVIGRSLRNFFRKHLGMRSGRKIRAVPRLFN